MSLLRSTPLTANASRARSPRPARPTRRLLVEAAQHYRRRPALGKGLQERQAGQDARVLQIAWRAQRRLHERWTHLARRRGKPSATVAIAIARELAAFCWEAATLS